MKTLLTGDRPTGKLHLGHYVGSIRNRIQLQDTHEVFILIADMQALTDNARTPDRIVSNILEVARDYLALGIDPGKCNIVIQSEIHELAQLYMHLSNFVGVGRVERNPTVKTEIKQKSMGEHVPAGFFMYPVSQVADIVGFKADVVPVGDDQAPMIELTNDIVDTYSSIFGEKTLKRVQGIFSSVGRLPAPDGKSKMSKSLGNVINFDMPDSIIKKFVNSMYPGIDARKIDEPGVVDGNVIITYLKAFDPNTEQLDELIKAYQLGGIGDSELKKRLYDVLLDFITPIRDKRTKLSDTFIADVLYEGTCAGKARVGEVLGAVERDMGIKYDESIFKGLKKE